MTWKNLLGGLALDATLGDLVEVLQGMQHGEETMYVASPEDGEPLNVVGRVEADDPSQGIVRINSNIVTSAPTKIASATAGRSAISVYCPGYNASLINMRLVNVPSPTVDNLSQSPYSLLLYPGDYWEAPAKFIGEIWAFTTGSNLAYVTEYF